MIKVNKYIEIMDLNKIIKPGVYRVGKDIPCGEYYLWGKNIRFTYKRKSEKETREYIKEVYYIFEDGDYLNFVTGEMTDIINLYYTINGFEMIIPDHIYRVGREIPEGYYLYKFDKMYFKELITFCEADECAIDMRDDYANSWCERESGRYGYVLLNSKTKYLKIGNGVAVYYGREKFDEKQIVKNCNVENNKFFYGGEKIFDNKILQIYLYAKYNDGSRFCGEIPIDVLNYEVYSIDGILKWIADIHPLSFKIPESMTIRFSDTTNVENSFVYKIDSFTYNYDQENYIGWYQVSQTLPSELIGKKITYKMLEYNGVDVKEPLLNNVSIHRFCNNEDIHTLFENEINILKVLLENYEGIDFDYELNYLIKTPDLIKEVNDCLQMVLDTSNNFIHNENEENRTIEFFVPTTYDKKYYCCAKLADKAYHVEQNENKNEYKVVFLGQQIEEIELMSYLLYDFANGNEVKNREWLNENSLIYFTMNAIQQKINNLIDKYGYSTIITNSVLARIIKIFNKRLQQKVDVIYSEIGKEGRIQTKWGNEYHLFMLISKYVQDTHYQYHCDWLGKQSYDIYLEKYKIAIEYQGQQHYEPVELFGGVEGLKDNIERDRRKKELSEVHGIKLLEWKYTVPVNDGNVINFLNDNNIFIDKIENEIIQYKKDDRLNMAPVIVKSQKTKKVVNNRRKSVNKIVKIHIVNYSLEGEIKHVYNTIGEAAMAVGVSSTSISKVLRGERNTAGGYVWKKYSVDDTIPDRIEILFDLGMTNSGTAKRVAKINDEGNVVEEYESIMAASKSCDIEYKKLQKMIKKNQGWKYV